MVPMISISMPSAEEISLLSPNPHAAARIVPSAERTMGVVSMVMDHRAADDDVGQLTRPMEKNSRCRSYPPKRHSLAPARNVTATKDDGVGLDDLGRS